MDVLLSRKIFVKRRLDLRVLVLVVFIQYTIAGNSVFWGSAN
jgi:hypothetical protein